jgi:hypothetical protein
MVETEQDFSVYNCVYRKDEKNVLEALVLLSSRCWNKSILVWEGDSPWLLYLDNEPSLWGNGPPQDMGGSAPG